MEHIFSFILSRHLRVRFPAHVLSACLILHEIAKLFSKVVLPFCISTAMYESSKDFESSTSLGIICLLT